MLKRKWKWLKIFRNIKRKVEVLDDKLSEHKLLRKQAYDIREKSFEDIFNNLHTIHKDDKKYYEQILKIREECDSINSIIEPYKVLRDRAESKRGKLSKILTFVLAPLSTIVLPLVCSLSDMSIAGEVATMMLSTISLITCAGMDEKLAHKIEGYEDTINELKSDRTVKYIKRDMKLNEALEYLKTNSMIDKNAREIPININVNTIIKKQESGKDNRKKSKA